MIRRIKKFLEGRLDSFVTYAILVVSVLLFFALFRNVSKMKDAEKKIQEAQKRVESLTEEKKELTEKLEEVNTRFYLEKQLRDQLGLAREDETVVVLPEGDILAKLAPQYHEEEETLPDPNWKKWYKLFF